jgi:uncharacterized Ntn-hydrolase superfamily protein
LLLSTGQRRLATCSIVARDPSTGEIGVACQSHGLAVGAVVAWAEAGIGAVATQAFADPSYGPEGLALMRQGLSAGDALASLLAWDGDKEHRQVGIVDGRGDVASHTGSETVPEAGAASGPGYSCLANMTEKAGAWSVMARAYENAEGDLAERMFAALEAAQAEGGDLRGKRSAALKVVQAAVGSRAGQGVLFDLRVDDHSEPLAELRRLARLQKAANHMNAGARAAAAGDWAKADREYTAAGGLDGQNPEIAFWHGLALVTGGDLDRARRLLHKAFDAGERWRLLARRLLKGQADWLDGA